MARTKQKWRRNKNRQNQNNTDKDGQGQNTPKDGEATNARKDDGRAKGYTLADKTNASFELFYKNQHIVSEADWETFLDYLKRPLPSTFRVTGFRSQARELVKLIQSQYLPSLSGITIEGRALDPPQCLSWYPGDLAWQLNLERGYIRKNDHLAKLHEFLVSETESGNISRQEAVSMIPPLLLDVKPQHKVLDMCAAPGSKTSQLIEMLHADENIPSPDGFVVANDSDNKRCYLMVHQVKRLESPNFVIINHDASQLPNLWTHDTNDRKGFITYDRVLCDVPCTGDGTLRKNVDVWTKWNPAAAHNLHNLQRRILKRGLELLTVGGRLVYSTCSFNPVENEAVVASMLDMCKGTVQLVDVSAQLPGLKRMSGMNTWKVMSKQNEFYDKFADVPDTLHTQIRPTMFPPAAEKQKNFNLNRCIRIVPHHQNTGGFFVAVLEKTDQMPWVRATNDGTKAAASTGENGAAAPNAGEKRKTEDDQDPEPPKKQKKMLGYKEDPFIWLNSEDPVWPPIKKFYGLTDEFRADLLMVRCGEGKKRNLYYTTEAIKNIATYTHRVKFINMGVKLFCRSDSQFVDCDFRIVQDGIATLFPYVTTRSAEIGPEDVVTILSQDNPYTEKLTTESRERVDAISQGGCVFVCKASGKPDTPACDIVLSGWKGRISCRSFLRKFERSHYLRMFGKELESKKEKKEDSTEDESSKMDEASGGAEVEVKKEKDSENESEKMDEASGGAEVEVKKEEVTDSTESSKMDEGS